MVSELARQHDILRTFLPTGICSSNNVARSSKEKRKETAFIMKLIPQACVLEKMMVLSILSMFLGLWIPMFPWMSFAKTIG